jgi:two-component system, NtrC family, sensor kinase
MVAGVAHEINTPLGYVTNNLEIAGEVFGHLQNLTEAYDKLIDDLQSGAIDEAKIHEDLAELRSSQEQLRSMFPKEEMATLFTDTHFGLKQISEIVVNLKDFSRLDQAALDNVDLHKCIDSALVIARNVTKHRAEVVREYGELPPLRCAPSQINQVILNLVGNAAHAIERPDGRITIRTQVSDNHAHIIITDNGKGIAPENVEKIFDPFFTTKPVGQGTGLGLSIVYRIVQDHKGHVRVKSQPGVGTAICISLPLNANQPRGATN